MFKKYSKRFCILSLAFVMVLLTASCSFVLPDAPSLQEIFVATDPAKVAYEEGGVFDPSDMVVKARYSDQSMTTVTSYDYSPKTPLTHADKTVTITYNGKQTTFPITVAPALAEIYIGKAPTKTTYNEGESFSPSGMEVRAKYTDDSTAAVSDYDYNPKTALTASDTYISVAYKGKEIKTPITVNRVMTGLVITTQPAKTTYLEGAKFSIAGMVVKVRFSDQSLSTVTSYDYNPKTELTLADTAVTITYQGLQTTVPITVVRGIKSLEVTTAPHRTSYVEGEFFQPAGMTVTATLTNGAKETVSDYDFKPKTALLTSSHSVTIFRGESETTLPLTVAPKKQDRGLCYSFTNEYGSSANDMDMMMGGQNGAKWFYNWGITPAAAAASNAKARNFNYIPMAWRNAWKESDIRAYKATRPDLEYILAFNEPNLLGQAEITPSEAGALWPRVKAIAEELDLKIVSPAMNGGTLPGYTGSDGAIRWLDEFFAHPNVSIDDVVAISIHIYVDYPSAFKNLIEKYKKYDKPIWVTEFCAWENQNNNITNNQWEWQARLMSQAIPIMELDPQVERYAWYIAKDPNGGNAYPYNKFMTGTSATSTLTELGKIYTNMSVCDKRVYVPVGTQMDAAQYTDCNISEWVGKSGFAESVRTQPSSDKDGVLEIHHFTQNEWVEYQVQATETKSLNLKLRYKTSASTSMSITVDGGTAKTTTLDSTAWANATVSMGTVPAGLHTIRLKVTNSTGNCALNWLELS